MLCLFYHSMQQFISKFLSKGFKKAHEIGKAEAKILFVTLAFILISSLILITFSYFVSISDQLFQILGNYFLCQSTGLQPDRECDVIFNARYRDLKLSVFGIATGCSRNFLSHFPVTDIVSDLCHKNKMHLPL